MEKHFFKLCLEFLPGIIFLLLTLQVQASEIISTYPSWEGAGWGYQIGEQSYNKSAYGQTFTAPDNNLNLDNFSIWLSDSPIFDPDPLEFKAYIMKWDADNTIGDILYSSDITDTSAQTENGEWLKYSFDIDLLLEENQDYVFFISVTNLIDSDMSGAFVGATSQNGYPVDGYSGGNMVFLNGDQSFLDSPAWGSSNDSYPGIGADLLFEANFSTVPEPEGLILLLTGLIWLLRTRTNSDKQGVKTSSS